MELQISFPILFTFFCFLLVVSFSLQRSKSNKNIKNLPPGPWKLPLIGNMHQLFGSLPHQALRNLSNKYGPIMHLQLGTTSNVVVSLPEIAQEDIFTAGTETSSTTTVWAMSELLRKPMAMDKAQSETRRVSDGKGYVDETELHQLQYLKLVVKETLRLHTPATLLLPRENNERCVINGYEIPAKTKTIINAWAIGRDPNLWSEAEKFQPERFLHKIVDFKGTNFEYIPFGAGRRICPGITFAMPNVELVLANFLYHFDWKLPKGMKNEDLDMTESFGLVVKRKNDLCLIPIPHCP